MTSDKKVIEIHGVLQKPLEIGSSAFILEDNGIRRTSTILEYKQVSENEIHFETLNTIYHLRLKQNKSLCGVILKHMIKTAEKSCCGETVLSHSANIRQKCLRTFYPW